MNNGIDSVCHSDRSPRSSLKPAALASALILALLLLAAACGSSANSPGVPSIDSTATSATESGSVIGTPSGTAAAQSALAYAQCMRSHGIPDFPDPNASGGFNIQGGPGSDLDPNSSAFQAAQSACKSLRPVPSAAQLQQMRDQMLKFSQCMRSHGISDFPDPSTNGGIHIHAVKGGDLDPNSPAFQAAQNACKSFMPGKFSTSSSNVGGQKP